jgi:predicted ABC-type ATPase
MKPSPDNLAMRHICIIAGSHGAGKTTFARRFIPASANITQFVNADLIASGLSPFAPEREAIQAGRLMLRQIDKLAAQSESFSFETTLSGRSYARMIPQWQARGYAVHLLFLILPDAETAIARVAARVAQGGHAISEDVIRRRFAAGLRNFHSVYKMLVNDWMLYDNTGLEPVLVATGENHVHANGLSQP